MSTLDPITSLESIRRELETGWKFGKLFPEPDPDKIIEPGSTMAPVG
jgi:hypothetical protein